MKTKTINTAKTLKTFLTYVSYIAFSSLVACGQTGTLYIPNKHSNNKHIAKTKKNHHQHNSKNHRN